MTAATYVSVGGAAPVRAGLSLVKDARKVGRLGEGLAEWAGRSARDVVDTPVLEEAVASSSVLRPSDSVSAISAAFRAEKAGALVASPRMSGASPRRLARAAHSIRSRLQKARRISRAARLAEAEGGKTRAILKSSAAVRSCSSAAPSI